MANSEIAVLVPVLSRPQNAQPLADSLNASTDRARLVFLCSPGDDAQIEACGATGEATVVTTFGVGHANWARKLELGRDLTSEPYMLLGADDLRFHAGWLEAVLATFERTGAGLVGTNDLANPLVRRGRHATHPVISREYADEGTVDNPALMVPQAYHHCWVDNELVQVAMARGRWAFAKTAHVEHMHPIFRSEVADDATYRRGQERYREDQRLFMERRKLWAA